MELVQAKRPLMNPINGSIPRRKNLYNVLIEVWMNSAQRRQARREFPHVVAIKAATSERYFEHDHRVSVAQTWCRRQFGRGNFRCQTDWDSTEFKFVREKDATLFALKWLQ